jgi:hypothetical protein
MSKKFPLLDLPTEVRLRIYELYFSSLIVRAGATLSPTPHTGFAPSLWLVCRQIREESAPFLYSHALFWVDSIPALIYLIRKNSSAQLQSIRHFAIRSTLLPLPSPTRGIPEDDQDSHQTPNIRRLLYHAFHEQICKDLQTLVLFNTTVAATRRRIMEMRAERSLEEERAFEKFCSDSMRLKAQLLVRVLKEEGVVTVGGSEKCIPFQIVLRYMGSDDKVMHMLFLSC